MIEKRKPGRPDFILLIPLVILVGLGLVMVHSASAVQSLELYRDSTFIFKKQMLAMLGGLVGFLILLIIPHHFYRRKFVMYAALLFVMALLIGLFFQEAANGARRWYNIAGFGFQPSDFAKIVIIMFIMLVLIFVIMIIVLLRFTILFFMRFINIIIGFSVCISTFCVI